MVRISGVIKDKFTAEKLPWTLIWFDEMMAHSDESGQYEIDLPPGRYTIRVRHSHYEPVTVPLQVGPPTIVDANLVRAV